MNNLNFSHLDIPFALRRPPAQLVKYYTTNSRRSNFTTSPHCICIPFSLWRCRRLEADSLQLWRLQAREYLRWVWRGCGDPITPSTIVLPLPWGTGCNNNPRDHQRPPPTPNRRAGCSLSTCSLIKRCCSRSAGLVYMILQSRFLEGNCDLP